MVQMYSTSIIIPASPPRPMPILTPVLRPSYKPSAGGVVVGILLSVAIAVVPVDEVGVGKVDDMRLRGMMVAEVAVTVMLSSTATTAASDILIGTERR